VDSFISGWKAEVGDIRRESVRCEKVIDTMKLTYKLHINFRTEPPADRICLACENQHTKTFDYRLVQQNRSKQCFLYCVGRGGYGNTRGNGIPYDDELWEEELPDEIKPVESRDFWSKAKYNAKLIEYDSAIAIPLEKFSEDNQPEITVQQSGMGTQKTRGVVTFLNESRKDYSLRYFDRRVCKFTKSLRVMILSAGRPLSVKLSNDFGAWNYMDGLKHNDADSICISMESLSKLFTYNNPKPYDVLIIDEAKKFIENLTSKTLKSTMIRNTYHILLRLFATTKRVILLDADAHMIYDLYHKMFQDAYRTNNVVDRHKLVVQLNNNVRNPYDYHFGTIDQIEDKFYKDVLAGKKVAAVCLTTKSLYKLLTVCTAIHYNSATKNMTVEQVKKLSKSEKLREEKIGQHYNDYFKLGDDGK
jgi:hypothetical protein